MSDYRNLPSRMELPQLTESDRPLYQRDNPDGCDEDLDFEED